MRFSGRRPRPDQAEEASRIIPFNVQMREKEVLINVACDQLRPLCVRVEERLDRVDVVSDVIGDLDGLARDRRPGCGPGQQRMIVFIGQRCRRERHAAMLVVRQIVLDLSGSRTAVAAQGTDVQLIGKGFAQFKGLPSSGLQQLFQDRNAALIGRDWKKSLLPPFGHGRRVDPQARGWSIFQPFGIIDPCLGRPALPTVRRRQFQLTGRVIAPVTNHTALVQGVLYGCGRNRNRFARSGSV